LLPTTYLLQISSEKPAICCAKNGGTESNCCAGSKIDSSRVFSSVDKPLFPQNKKTHCPKHHAEEEEEENNKKQQHLLRTTTHVATPEWIWVLLTEARILSQICRSLLSLNPTYPQQHDCCCCSNFLQPLAFVAMMMIFFCRKNRHHAWLVEFGCISGTNYTLAHSCLQRTKGKMMGAYSSSSFSSQRRRST
jgi:hypothetical protein